MQKNFSQSCENNKQPILDQLKRIYPNPVTVLEIGSGTGQHALFFAQHLPHLTWQPSEQAGHLDGLKLYLDEVNLPNINNPLQLNIRDYPWPMFAENTPQTKLDAVFSANTLHIMSWEEVQIFFIRLGQYLRPRALFCSYGPFNKNDQFSSESNARFDRWLKDRDPLSGIRDQDQLVELAEINGLALKEVINMPANNLILVWEKF